MKKFFALLLAAMMLLSASALAEILTGSAKGFKGDVHVALLVEDGKIVDIGVRTPDDTPHVADPAVAELKKAILEKGGIEGVDVVSGATYTSNGVINAVKAALGMTETAEEPTAETKDLVTVASGSGLTLCQAQFGRENDQGFALMSVVMNGDKVVLAYIDEFQVMDKNNAWVANSEAMFADLAAAEKGLASKRANNEGYSKTMAAWGGATKTIAEGYEAIQAFCAGKTAADLEAALGLNNVVDAVSGSTLSATKSYLQGILSAVKTNTAAADASAPADVKFGQVVFACHGTKCFAVVSVVMNGDKVALAHIDEFQVMDNTFTWVPNNAALFADLAAAGKGLASKRINDAAYSKNMTKAGSTQNISVSYDAIQAFCVGKTVAELEAVVGLSNVVDAVSGSTLADTKGYILGVIEAAKVAK